MKTKLEVNNSPAEFNLKAGLVTLNGNAVSTDEMVTVCAWHGFSKWLTQKLDEAGYEKISHGCCEDCAEKMNSEIDANNGDD